MRAPGASWILAATVGGIATMGLGLGLALREGGKAAVARQSRPPNGVAERPVSPAIPERLGGPEASEPRPDRLAELAAAVNALRTDVARLEAEVARVSASQTPTAAQRRSADRSPGPAPDRHERLARLERGFTDEPRNATWAAQAVDTLTAALDFHETVRTQVRSVACRSQTCRVELAADTDGATAKLLPELLLELGTTFPLVNAGAADGPDGPSTVLFLSTRRPEAPRPERDADPAGKPGRPGSRNRGG